jgi:hypothetical protein
MYLARIRQRSVCNIMMEIQPHEQPRSLWEDNIRTNLREVGPQGNRRTELPCLWASFDVSDVLLLEYRSLSCDGN